MAGFFDFLTALFKPEDKKDTSVVVKNYISGNNNQNNNRTSSRPKKGPDGPRTSQSSKGTRQTSTGTQIALQSIRLYSTGAKGKVYTNNFYKSVNHNFGIELVIINNTSQTQTVSLGHCIYDESGVAIINGNFHPKIAPHSKLTQDIYVEAKTFAKLKNGKYKSQFWLNNTKVQKVYFTIASK